MRMLNRVPVLLVFLGAVFFAASDFSPTLGVSEYHELLTLGRGTADVVAWNPDGDILAVGGSRGIYLYDAEFHEVNHLDNVPERVMQLSWHPGGAMLAFTTVEGRVARWNVETGAMEDVFFPPDDAGGYHPMTWQEWYGVSWSPDGIILATGGANGRLRLWNPESSETVVLLDDITQPIHALAWSPDSSHLAVGSGNDGVVYIWDVASRRVVSRLQGSAAAEDQQNTVRMLAWDPSGLYLAAIRDFHTVEIWDVTHEVILATPSTSWYATTIEWNADGTRLATQDRSLNIQIWNTTTWVAETILDAGATTVRMDWNPADGRLVAISEDDRVFLWDTNTQQLLDVFQEHTDMLLNVTWNWDGTQLAVSNVYDYIQIWDAETGQLNRVLDIPPGGAIWSLDWSAPNDYLAGGFNDVVGGASFDSFVIVWDVTTGDVVHELDIGSDVHAIAWRPDGVRLAVAGSEGMITLWDSATWRAIDEFESPSRIVNQIIWNPDGTQLALAGNDGTTSIVDITSRETILTLEQYLPTLEIDWHPASHLLITSNRQELTVWDTTTAVPLLEFWRGGFSLSPDGELLAYSTGFPSEINIIEARTGVVVDRLDGYAYGAGVAGWSPDGTKLAGVSGDFVVHIWGR